MAHTLISARWLVTATTPASHAPTSKPQTRTIADGAVLIDDSTGRIVAVGDREALQAQRRHEAHVALAQHILCPGLVNAHAHSAMALLRGAADDLPLERWLRERIWPMEAELLDESFVSLGTRLAALEMLAGGTTTCADMYFYAEAAAEAYLEVGLRAVLALPVIDFPTRYATDVDGYISRGLAARDRFADEPLLAFCLAPHAPYTASDSTFRRVLAFCDELGIGLHTHLHETAAEVSNAVAQHGERPVARLARLGVLGPGFFAAHGVHLDAIDIATLARHGASIVHCPSSNLKLASGIAPVPALLAAGVNVGLGTDGAASNNRLDMFGEMRLAALLGKVAGGDAAALNASEAFVMATLGGARALGLGECIGSIEEGKSADLIAVAVDSPGMTPLYDPVSHLVYAAGRSDVTDVWVAGQRRMNSRALRTATGLPAVAAMAEWAPQIVAMTERVNTLRSQSSPA